MEPTKNKVPASPLRVLSGLLSAKEQHCQRAADTGGLFEVNLLRGHLDRARTSVAEASAEAGVIVRESGDVLRVVQESRADGVITPDESEKILRAASQLDATAVPHYIRLRRLA